MTSQARHSVLRKALPRFGLGLGTCHHQRARAHAIDPSGALWTSEGELEDEMLATGSQY